MLFSLRKRCIAMRVDSNDLGHLTLIVALVLVVDLSPVDRASNSDSLSSNLDKSLLDLAVREDASEMSERLEELAVPFIASMDPVDMLLFIFFGLVLLVTLCCSSLDLLLSGLSIRISLFSTIVGIVSSRRRRRLVDLLLAHSYDHKKHLRF